MPRSRARCRTAGEDWALPPAAAGAGAFSGVSGFAVFSAGFGSARHSPMRRSSSSRSSPRRSSSAPRRLDVLRRSSGWTSVTGTTSSSAAGTSARPSASGSSGGAEAAALSPTVSTTIRTLPIGIWSPTSPATSITLPATGDSISTVALSVIRSAICWSSAMSSPTLTCQATISASAMPSPMSGSLNSKRAMACQSSNAFFSAGPSRAGPGK